MIRSLVKLRTCQKLLSQNKNIAALTRPVIHNKIQHLQPLSIFQPRFCSSSSNLNKQDASIGQVEPAKMFLSYTCKVCNTKNSKIISKQAYTKGVVIVRCEGCDNLHLIADNLGWWPDLEGKTNIEQILAEKGETVNRGSVDLV